MLQLVLASRNIPSSHSHEDAGPSLSRTSSAESCTDIPQALYEEESEMDLPCRTRRHDKSEKSEILRRRVQDSTRKGKERTERNLHRLFPDENEYAEIWNQFRQYQHIARKYGVDQAKVKILGQDDIKRYKRKKKRTEAEKLESRQQASERFVIRRRLKKVPDDPIMLARAKEMGMDLDHMTLEREKVDYVLRFLEIYHPDLIPYHLVLSKDQDSAIKKHPIGFRYLTKKRTEMEEVLSSDEEREAMDGMRVLRLDQCSPELES